jgi:sugar lactone lactonase YvrE
MVDGGDGTVIIAFYNPAAVINGRAMRFDLNSKTAIEEWITPGSPRVTCPLLMEQDGSVRLMLTTATEGMPEEQRRNCTGAGDLFVAETSLADVPTVDTLLVEN